MEKRSGDKMKDRWNEEVLNLIKEILSGKEFMLENPKIITPDTRLLEDLSMDSLSLVALVSRIESEMNIYIPEELFKFQDNVTVQDIINTIKICKNR